MASPPPHPVPELLRGPPAAALPQATLMSHSTCKGTRMPSSLASWGLWSLVLCHLPGPVSPARRARSAPWSQAAQRNQTRSPRPRPYVRSCPWQSPAGAPVPTSSGEITVP